jgi:hypothetical protein
MVSPSSWLPCTKTAWSAPAFTLPASSCPRETSPAEATVTVVTARRCGEHSRSDDGQLDLQK